MQRNKTSTRPSGHQRLTREEQQELANHRLQQARPFHDQHVSFYQPQIMVDHYNNEQQSDDDQDWRQGAQMLTEQDELQLILGRDTTDVAPVRRPSQQRALRSPDFSLDKQSKQRRPAKSTGRSQVSSSGTRKVIRNLHSASPEGRQRLLSEQFANSTSPSLNEPEDELNQVRGVAGGHRDEEDDNSSISFAQSGCHSILSAWRTRAANRAARLTAAAARQPARPTSVLSNASSTKKSVASTALTLASRAGKSPAARTRIPLGPQQAQHFVTNSRRRRRANELILSTLEARRRALALNRQHLGSLFGSESYLLEAAGEYPVHSDYQRLSMSPSPQQQQQSLARPRSKTPDLVVAPAFARSALSDLGGVKHLSSGPRKRLVAPSKHPKAAATQQKRPPLAKLDQNSSDLCTSNGSSDDDDDDSPSLSSSDGSHFTQLVTSELSPQCIILDEQVGAINGRSRVSKQPERQTMRLPGKQEANEQASYWQQLKRSPSQKADSQTPKPPERTRKRPSVKSPNELNLFNDQQKQQAAPQERQDPNLDKFGGKFRRASLKRDSIRRLRLTRQQQQAASESTNSSDNNNSNSNSSPQSSPKHQATRVDMQTQRPLSKSRKLNTDSSPSLDRHHFRSLSARSSVEESSGGGRQAASMARRTTMSPPPLIRPSEASSQFKQRASLRLEGQRTKANAGLAHDNNDNIRQVEQMLRQMKPNQVFASNSKTNENRLTSLAAASSSSSASKAANQRQPEHSTGSRRLVGEGAKTSDNLIYDLKGNRRQLELDERWRHDRIEPTRRPDGSLFSEDRLISQRVEVSRESSSVLLPSSSHIEPPAEFADKSADQRRATSTTQVRRRPAEADPRPPIRSKSPTVSRTVQPVQSDPRRAQSEERRRPIVPAKPAQRLQKTPQQVATPASRRAQPPPIESHARPIDAAKVLQASLPKFELTADDEFRKRVDQLRQMAKANLREPPLVSSGASSRRRPPNQPDQRQLTRPLSTNWDGVATSTSGRDEPRPAPRPALERSKSSLESVPSSGLLQSQSSSRQLTSRPLSPTALSKQNPIATNLDAMMLADRYQRPLTSSGWRRSNSSLASLSAPRSTVARPSSPFGLPKQTTSGGGGSGSVLSQSVLSVGPTSGDSSQAMRLVVREKSAPKLDYAVRTERPLSPVKPPTTTTTTTATTTSVKTLPQPQQRPAPAPRPVQPRQPPMRATPSGQRVSSSPRSPELTFGAASSNDDSAIASSVSSPSLSYMINNPQTLVAEAQRRNNQAQRLASPIQSISTAKQTSNLTAMTTTTTSTPMNTNTRQPANLTARNLSPTGGHQQQIDQARNDNGGQSIGANSTAANLPSILRRQQHLSNLEAARRLMAASESEQQQQQQQQVHHHQEQPPVPAGSRLVAAFQPTSQQVGSYQSAPGSAGPLVVGRQSPLVIAQQRQQAAEEIGRKRVDTTAATTTTTSVADQQAANNPTKRVHFNDRASIRSFESISSLNSNSTAVPLNAHMIRQQVGSPDSMGSGSTSRLSGGDSPDPRRGSGAAIYAIRGDPDLENVENQQPVRPASVAPARLQQVLVPSLVYQQQVRQQQQQQQQQTRPMLLQSQQQQLMRQPMPMNVPPQSRPFIRMTAPPSMSSGQQHQPAQMSPNQYQVRPNLGHPALVQPPAALNPSSHVMHRQPLLMSRQVMSTPGVRHEDNDDDDDEDPDYALRLRQAAATNRVFSSYAQQPLHSPGQQIHSPGQQQQQPMPSPSARPTSGGGGGSGSRRAPFPGELANFQTEV